MLKLKNIQYKYDKQAKHWDLSLLNVEVKAGECVLFCGPSGSGKSTIAKLINSLIPNFYENGELQGNILLNGLDTQQSPIYQISQVVSSVFQNPKTQFFNINTSSEILFYLENLGYDRDYMKERLAYTADLFGIKHLLNRNIFALSGGEKQIIAIAAAFASDTAIILLDEPSSNLDQNKSKLIGEILEKIKQQGKTILITEHRFYYIKSIIDRVYYIANGEIQAEFSQTEFFALSEEQRMAMGLRSLNLPELKIKNNQNAQGTKVLEIENLHYLFKGTNRGLNFPHLSFNYGTIVGIYGHNGIGKSTLIRIIMGLEKTKARFSVNKKSLSNRQRLKQSFLVMQDVNHQLFTDSVETEVSLGKAKEYSKERVGQVLRQLNLDDLKDRHPMSLSGGQKQRVAIASAILSGAEFICFDEPTSGMDYEHMMGIATLIKNTINENRILFIISHDHEFLNATADQLFNLENYC